MAIEELIIILLTTVLVSITGYYARVTHKMLKFMQRQSEAITRPYLTINVFSEPHGVLYYLRIANTGRTGASNVRLTLDRDFYQLGARGHAQPAGGVSIPAADRATASRR